LATVSAGLLFACGSSSHGGETATDAGSSVPSTSSATDAGSDAAAAQLDANPLASSDASQGDGATQAAPPPVVTRCDGDGGLGPVGVWQQVWLPQSFLADQKLETSAVAVDPHDQSVYVAAGSYTNGGNSGTGIYQSTDCGATFHLASTGADATQVAGGDPWVLRANPNVPGTLYLVVGYGTDGFYESTDRGADWTLLATSPWVASGMPALSVQALAVSPGSTASMALTFHADCSSPYNALCFGETTNGGATWTAINGPALSTAGWQEAASLSILAPNALLYLGATSGSVSYSNDNGASWSTPTFTDATGHAVTPGVMESYSGSTHAGPDGTLYLGTPTGVFESGGATLGTQWTMLATSPAANSLIDDGTYLYASYAWSGDGQYGNGDGQVFWRASLSDLSDWVNMASPQVSRGSYEFAYDAVHHVVYSANMIGGLWRLVTQ
jgi:hypothetical protein